ncbi:2OG-Fe(II) oxygenase [Lysobacter arvi]|uniref:2OG-Fe(II) oxygenase n=1 Tax=Lysobacter arvi TaxID=3038776 RepID=A0ABU1CBL0_9GAMM|nr:2OG-Fe(II) oxygenase [Lysobacter arvi]MDR0182578.1 2OG-Fe(II) oxygenase [Lysobacter arvi]
MLSEEWIDWVRENLARGCTRESLMLEMLRNNISSEDTLQAFRDAAEAPHAEVTHVPCWPERFVFRSCNQATIDGREIRVLARLQRPAAVLLENVLSATECEALIALSSQRMTPSTVVDPESGELAPVQARSSEGTWFARGAEALIARIETRLAQIMDVPVAHGEGLQVLHYRVGGEYRPHHDYFPPDARGSARHMREGGQRTASLILYLNDVEAGGETIFPLCQAAFVPRRGRALYFAYCDPTGRLDPASLHGGAPVEAGEKWIATKWVRQRAYGVRPEDGLAVAANARTHLDGEAA